MPRGNPLTDAQKRRIRALHKKGLGRNAIAREAGVSLATVTKVCQDAGLSFDRTKTAVAVAARQIDNRARRVALVDRLYGRAEHVLDRLEADIYRYTIAVAGSGVEKIDDVEPPAQDERHLGSAVAGYLTAAARLEQVDGDPGVSKVSSVIERVAAAFGVTDG